MHYAFPGFIDNQLNYFCILLSKKEYEVRKQDPKEIQTIFHFPPILKLI